MTSETDEEMKGIGKEYGTLPSQHDLMPDGTPQWQLEQPPPEPAIGGGGAKPKK
jgi:hypothetical protein